MGELEKRHTDTHTDTHVFFVGAGRKESTILQKCFSDMN